MGLLNDITAEISSLGANFISLNAFAKDDGSSKLSLLFVLSDLSMVDKILNQIEQINGVLAVYRAAHSSKKEQDN